MEGVLKEGVCGSRCIETTMHVRTSHESPRHTSNRTSNETLFKRTKEPGEQDGGNRSQVYTVRRS